MAKVKFVKAHDYSSDGIKISHFKAGEVGEVNDADVERLVKKGKIEVKPKTETKEEKEAREALEKEEADKKELAELLKKQGEGKRLSAPENKRLEALQNK